MIDEIVDVLDSWLAKQVIGRPKVNEVIKMFTQVKDAPEWTLHLLKFKNCQSNAKYASTLPSTAVGKASQQVPARPVVPRGGGKNTSSRSKAFKLQRGGAQQQVKNNAPTAQSSAAAKAKKAMKYVKQRKARWSTGVLAGTYRWLLFERKA